MIIWGYLQVLETKLLTYGHSLTHSALGDYDIITSEYQLQKYIHYMDVYGFHLCITLCRSVHPQYAHFFGCQV